MNLYGAYTRLKQNSIAAMISAIEIYNKPKFNYRDECHTILLINAWELLLKAILSKKKQKIYYPKKEMSRTELFSLNDSLNKAKQYFPESVNYEPVKENVLLLEYYRNNSIHFYNQQDFSIVIYGLLQTSIVNYNDLLIAVFGIDMGEFINISLLPLSFNSSPDPISFIEKSQENNFKSKAVSEFMSIISQRTSDFEKQNIDTTRFLSKFAYKLVSTKKITTTNTSIGIDSNGNNPAIIERKIDPNISHPLMEKDVVKRIGPTLQGAKFTPYTFRAIAFKYDLRSIEHLCWKSDNFDRWQYSHEIIAFIKKLTKNEINESLSYFKKHAFKKK